MSGRSVPPTTLHSKKVIIGWTWSPFGYVKMYSLPRCLMIHVPILYALTRTAQSWLESGGGAARISLVLLIYRLANTSKLDCCPTACE
jgi:hypothetical protein